VEHPGLDTAEMRAIGHKGYYGVAKDRDGVTEVFVSAEIKSAVKKLGIKLISYADLTKMSKK
ncbi:MAG: polysaccharide deacetylase family protein, partial [Planctomycetota bacterium]